MASIQQLLKAFEKLGVIVKPTPDLQKNTGKGLLVPRPKALTPSEGPFPETKIVKPTETNVFVDPNLKNLSEEDYLATLARGQAEINEQTIGTLSPLLTGKTQFMDKGVPITEQLRDIENTFPGTTGVPDPSNPFVLKGRQGTTGAGRIQTDDPFADPLATIRDRIAEFSVKNKAPELARGMNSTTSFPQESAFVRSRLAGKGAEPIGDNDFINNDVFTKANNSLKAFMDKVGKSAGANPSIARSRQLGPSSPNYVAQSGLDAQTFGILNPGKSSFLDQYLDILGQSRSGPPKTMEAFGQRNRSQAPTDDIKLPQDQASELADTLDDVKSRTVNRESTGGNVDLSKTNRRSTTIPEGERDTSVSFDRIKDSKNTPPGVGPDDTQPSMPTIEEAAGELGLTVEEVLNKLGIKKPKRQARPKSTVKKLNGPEEVTISNKSKGSKATKLPTEPVESQEVKGKLLEADTLSRIIDELNRLKAK